MGHGKEVYRIRQTGEYLVAAELCRRGWVATPFAGNLPHYDILAADWSGRQVLVQVKTIHWESSWQWDASKFVEIRMEEERQVLGQPRNPPYPGLICVLVRLGESYGKDEFYILTWEDLRERIIADYRRYLERHQGVRPRNPRSTHAMLTPKELTEYKDNWDLLQTAGRAE